MKWFLSFSSKIGNFDIGARKLCHSMSFSLLCTSIVFLFELSACTALLCAFGTHTTTVPSIDYNSKDETVWNWLIVRKCSNAALSNKNCVRFSCVDWLQHPHNLQFYFRSVSVPVSGAFIVDSISFKMIICYQLLFTIQLPVCCFFFVLCI